MSPDDVDRNEMDAPHDFDDAAADALVSGRGRDVDPALADLLGDVRVAYISTPPVVGAALAEFIGTDIPAPHPAARRFSRMRSSFAAKMAAATAAVVAATGGLAVAGALPAPAQHALAAIGIGSDDSHNGDVTEPAGDTGSTTATTVDDKSSTTADHPDNHGDGVSAVAHDDASQGCEHGREVSEVASGTETSDSEVSGTDVPGTEDDKPCPTTPTTLGNTTHDGAERDDEGKGEPEADADADDATTPTTAASASHDGDHSGDQSGDHSGDSGGDGTSGGSGGGD